MSPPDIGTATSGFLEEARSARLYRELAAIEQDPRIARMYRELAEAANQQAAFWAARMRQGGGQPPADVPLGLRARLALGLARKIGIRPMRGVLSTLKVRGLSIYSAPAPPGHPHPISVGDFGRRHRTGAGNLRAAVFGVNDGLVSNASLIMGMAGAAAEPRTLLLAGIAGLLAGAFSMAAGEYVSVRSQREVFEYQIGLEREELEEYPDAEAEELALIYQAKGFPRDDAQRMARTLIADPERALDTLARKELGLNPDELGSPWGAATSLPINWVPPGWFHDFDGNPATDDDVVAWFDGTNWITYIVDDATGDRTEQIVDAATITTYETTPPTVWLDDGNGTTTTGGTLYATWDADNEVYTLAAGGTATNEVIAAELLTNSLLERRAGYQTGPIEDLANVNLNYYIEVKDPTGWTTYNGDTGEATFTLRITPIEAAENTVPPWLTQVEPPVEPPVVPPVVPPVDDGTTTPTTPTTPVVTDDDGGCTMATGKVPFDPTLPLLLAGGVAAIALRRRASR